MKKIKVIIIALFLVNLATASNNYTQTDTVIPKVFILGEFDGAPFEALKAKYETSLVTLCHNDMEIAYYSWVHTLKGLEAYSEEQSFDLKGLKFWMYAFWNKDGTIDYLAFHLKPNSRNLTDAEMAYFKLFLTNFCNHYTFPIKSDKNFSNYAPAAFPVMIEKLKN
jgi:hypothetical protein